MDCLDRLMKNKEDLAAVLKPYNMTLPDYLALTDGAPTEPLALPPMHMDREAYIETAEALLARLQAARDNGDSDSINQVLRERYLHLFSMRPIQADKFRATVGALIEERCALMHRFKVNGGVGAI